MTELAMIAASPSEIEKAADPAEFVIQACERAKSWLAEVLAHGEIEKIVELKSQAEAVRIYTLSKQLGKDAELSAAEIVRRAERGIGAAVRKGQREGSIRSMGKPPKMEKGTDRTTTSPSQYFESPRERQDIYTMTDGVSDDDFELAIKQARAEENMSRANIMRKAKNDDTIGRDKAVLARKRLPISDTARDAGWALRKDVERIENILTDDRFTASKEKVAAHLHGHLTYAVQALSQALSRISPQGD